MQFHVITRTHVRRFTLVHVAKCHSTIWWIMSSHFPWLVSRQQYVRRQETIDTTVPLIAQAAESQLDRLLRVTCKYDRLTSIDYWLLTVKNTKNFSWILYQVSLPAKITYQEVIQLYAHNTSYLQRLPDKIIDSYLWRRKNFQNFVLNFFQFLFISCTLNN